jgi:hypothetical protein
MANLKETRNIHWPPCAAHKLQTCINKARKNCREASAIISKAQSLSEYVRNHNSVKEALETLQELNGDRVSGLLNVNTTRWNTHYLMMKRLVKHIDIVKEVQVYLLEDEATRDCGLDVERKMLTNEEVRDIHFK